jgi:ribosomal protein S12 methylthiotransferase accessory factor YcaO-like protein
VNLTVVGGDSALAPVTRQMLRRMHCPLTGLSQEIGFVMRSCSEPRVAVAGGEMTGVHVLRGTPPPKRGAYHIGGAGTSFDEAMIRTLGETVERYAQFTPKAAGAGEVTPSSLRALHAGGRRALAVAGLRLFSAEQHARAGFPFHPVDETTEVGWIRRPSLEDGAECWLPAQQAAVGYRGLPGEPRYA